MALQPLTPFEAQLLHAVLKPYELKRPNLCAQLPHVGVRSREVSPCGGYVNFALPDEAGLPTDDLADGPLEVDQMVACDSPPNGLGFVVHVTGGKLHFLELFTYLDDTWDGAVRNPRLVDI